MKKSIVSLLFLFACITADAEHIPPPPPPHTLMPGNGEIAHFVHLHTLDKLFTRERLIRRIDECQADRRARKLPVKPIPPSEIPDEVGYTDEYVYSAKNRVVTFAYVNYTGFEPLECQLLKSKATESIEIRSNRGHCTLHPKKKIAVGKCDGNESVNFPPSEKGRRKPSGTKLVLGHKCNVYDNSIPDRRYAKLDSMLCLSSEGSFVGYPKSGLIKGIMLSMESEVYDTEAKTAIFDMPVSASLFEIPPDYKIHSPKAKRKRGNDDEDESENEGKD